jgi:hypothetical protein
MGMRIGSVPNPAFEVADVNSLKRFSHDISRIQDGNAVWSVFTFVNGFTFAKHGIGN